jgi:CCR4-NOT transcription complex subunit 2
MMESVPTSTSSTSSVTSSDGRSGAVGGSEFLNLGMFGQSSGSGDLLLGTSGFGGGLGNGYGSDFGLGSTVKTSAFDLNDFPSLGGVVAGTVGPSTPGNGLAAALRQQQQLLAHQQMLQSGSSGSKSPNLYRLAMSSAPNAVPNFNMATEDFPALPGAPPSGGGGSSGSGTEPGGPPLSPGGNTAFVTSMSRISSSGASGSGLYGFDLDGGSNQSEGAGLLGGLGGLSLSSGSNPSSTLGHQRASTPSSTSVGNVGTSAAPGPGAGSSGGGSTLSGDYGLLGLLGVIRMTDADRNALALGSDLTLLGLNLNSNDQLYSTFASPWSENPATKEPHYQVRTFN